MNENIVKYQDRERSQEEFERHERFQVRQVILSKQKSSQKALNVRQ